MKFVRISPKNRTAWNFRGDLIKDITKLGYEVIVTGPNDIDVDKIEALGARFVKIPMEKTGVNIISDQKFNKSAAHLVHITPSAHSHYHITSVIHNSQREHIRSGRYERIELGDIPLHRIRKDHIADTADIIGRHGDCP